MNETMENLVLTTKDNPFNPKTHYDNWKAWDEQNGYYTEAYVARVADIPVDADLEDDVMIEQMMDAAIRIILDDDVTEMYVLV